MPSAGDTTPPIVSGPGGGAGVGAAGGEHAVEEGVHGSGRRVGAHPAAGDDDRVDEPPGEEPDQHAHVGGVSVAAGTILWVSFAAVNRDLRAVPDAARFDPDRTREPRHLAFGHGIHHCVGAALARLQLTELLTRTARRFPALRLAGDVPELDHIALRASLALPVRLGP